MENVLDILDGAPWWVWVIFVYLLIIGIKARRPRTIRIQMIVLIPALFLAWSLFGLYENLLQGFPSLLPLWIGSLALGIYLGIKEVHSWHILKDRPKRRITIPGNNSTLVLMLLVFISKFFWGYIYETRTEISYWIYFGDTLSSALVTGVFVGRTSLFLKRYLS